MTDPLAYLDEIDARDKVATKGPWRVGDWWHIQGAEHCPCRPDWGPAIVQRMRINGVAMLAHRHLRTKPIDSPVINTDPYPDGFPRAVVITADEYGAIDPDNAEFIAHARQDLPALSKALRAVLELHRPVDIEPSDTICHECSAQLPNGRYFLKVVEFPCPTVRAIQAALAVNNEGGTK